MEQDDAKEEKEEVLEMGEKQEESELMVVVDSKEVEFEEGSQEPISGWRVMSPATS